MDIVAWINDLLFSLAFEKVRLKTFAATQNTSSLSLGSHCPVSK